MEETTPDREDERALDELMLDLAQAEMVLEGVTARVKKIRAEIADEMARISRKRHQFERGGFKYSSTLVVSSPIVVDFDGLADSGRLTVEELDMISETKFSKKLLEDAVDDGRIEAGKVLPFLSRSKETRSVRYKREPVQGDEQDGAAEGDREA